MSSVTDEDLLHDSEQATVGHNSLAELSRLVEQHQDLSRKLSDAEDTVKALKAEIVQLEMRGIPDMMATIGLEQVTTTEGAKVTVKQFITGSIPKKNMTEAGDWLREHGFGDLIRQDITVTFVVGQDKDARTLVGDLEKKGLAPSVNESVHASTLKSWAREQIEQGADLPLKLLGLTNDRKAEIKLPKPKKK